MESNTKTVKKLRILKANNQTMITSKKDIDAAIEELHSALMESVDASQAEDKAKIRKMKAQKRLSMARDAVRALTIN